MIDHLYLLDTNVLYFWALDLLLALPRSQQQAARVAGSDLRDHRAAAAARAFCETPAHPLFIPGVVWCELLGVFLQKDLETDPLRYPQWQKLRKAALQPLHRAIFTGAGHVELGEGEFDLDLAMDICHRPVSPEVLRRMRGTKLLDGIDASILACAWRLAESRPAQQVFLVSDDWGLRQMVQELRSARTTIGRHRFPANLQARGVLR